MSSSGGGGQEGEVECWEDSGKEVLSINLGKKVIFKKRFEENGEASHKDPSDAF